MFYIVSGISALVFAGRFMIPSHELSWPGICQAWMYIFCGYLIADQRTARKNVITVLLVVMMATFSLKFRPSLPWSDTYEGLTHMWVGFLFGVIADDEYPLPTMLETIVFLTVITALEIVMFLTRS